MSKRAKKSNWSNTLELLKEHYGEEMVFNENQGNFV